MGIAKPNQIFEHALFLAGNPAREKVLMVGDTFETDILGGILGGINAKFDTCWLNSERKPFPQNFIINHQICSISELQDLLQGIL